MNKLEAVQHYIKHTAIPKRLGRVIYNQKANIEVINAIRDAGLTPIPLNMYRMIQAREDNREYVVNKGHYYV